MDGAGWRWVHGLVIPIFKNKSVVAVTIIVACFYFTRVFECV